MCRSGDQGGRRCPTSSGERRRARDAANTAARRARAALAKAEAAGDPAKITVAQERLNRAVNRVADLRQAEQADTGRAGDTTPPDAGGPPIEAGPVGSIGHITATESLTVISNATGPVHISPAHDRDTTPHPTTTRAERDGRRATRAARVTVVTNQDGSVHIHRRTPR